MRNFAEANDYLSKGRNPNGRTLQGRSTRVIRRDADHIAVEYHETDVVTYHRDGRVTLNSGGWRTVTTKARMNEYSPFRISQSQGVWYVRIGDNWQGGTYAEGITWHPDGTITGAGEDPRAQLKLRAKVRRFAGEYIKKLAAGEIPKPGNGDCWGCLMRATDGTRPMGGSDHILSHLEEKYFVPSLIVRAFEEFGAAPVQKWGLAEIWGTLMDSETGEPFKGESGFRKYATDDRSRRMLARFMYRELGLAA